jgi:hypothetical protein
MILIPLRIQKCVFSRRFGATALPSDVLHSHTILYLASSLKTVIKEPTLFKLLTFHVPNLIPIFRHLGSLSKESAQVRGSLEVASLFFYGEGLLVPCPTPKLEDHPFSLSHGCLFNIFAANLYSWRLFLHLQPEDVSSCGYREPPNMA